MVLQRFNGYGSLIIFSIIMLDPQEEGDHPKTILLVARGTLLSEQFFMVKGENPSSMDGVPDLMITTPSCKSSSQSLRSQSLVLNPYFHFHPFQSRQNIHNLSSLVCLALTRTLRCRKASPVQL